MIDKVVYLQRKSTMIIAHIISIKNSTHNIKNIVHIICHKILQNKGGASKWVPPNPDMLMTGLPHPKTGNKDEQACWFKTEFDKTSWAGIAGLSYLYLKNSEKLTNWAGIADLSCYNCNIKIYWTIDNWAGIADLSCYICNIKFYLTIINWAGIADLSIYTISIGHR